MNIPRCEPPVWADSGHLQTLLGYILPSEKLRSRGKSNIITLADGDRIHAEYIEGSSNSLVLLFHGLNGTIASNYMARTANLALTQGHSVALVNHRDCGIGLGLAKEPYHSGRGEDVSDVIGFYRSLFPNKRLIAMGFSLGANALLNLLCQRRGTNQPDFAVAVNGPTDLRASAELLKVGFNRIYDLRFVWSCRQEILNKAKSGRIEFNKSISYFSYLRDIDEIYTAPYGGFKNADDYYDQCSTFKHLQNIKTPTVIIMAKDDPFIPWEPYLNAQHNSNVVLHLEDRGGHLGYLATDTAKQQSQKRHYRRWLDDALDIVLKENA
ncbi:MAG: thioesterase [Bdellovibrionaceae bacterium]|nr:thioesterase [Pseudobdellovibrionaceae bacterium]